MDQSKIIETIVEVDATSPAVSISHALNVKDEYFILRNASADCMIWAIENEITFDIIGVVKNQRDHNKFSKIGFSFSNPQHAILFKLRWC